MHKCNQRQINQFSMEQEITWTFNPPSASHMGGAWEQVMCSVRCILGVLLKTQTPSDEAFSTLMLKLKEF